MKALLKASRKSTLMAEVCFFGLIVPITLAVMVVSLHNWELVRTLAGKLKRHLRIVTWSWLKPYEGVWIDLYYFLSTSGLGNRPRHPLLTASFILLFAVGYSLTVASISAGFTLEAMPIDCFETTLYYEGNCSKPATFCEGSNDGIELYEQEGWLRYCE